MSALRWAADIGAGSSALLFLTLSGHCARNRSVFPWNALSQRGKVTGRAFDRQIGSTKRGDRYADCRIRTEFAFDRHICYATGDRKWSSGESRLKRLDETWKVRLIEQDFHTLMFDVEDV